LADAVDASVRLKVGAVGERELFVGIGPADEVAAYLGGVARDEIRSVERDVEYRRFAGSAQAAPPVDQGFWVASANGAGALELVWEVTEGEWAAVLMNADGSPGVVADVTAGLRVGALVAIAIGIMVASVLLLAAAVAIIVVAAKGAAPAEAPAGGEAAGGWVEPVRLEAVLDEPLSPWKWLVKWILAIPHFIILALLWVAFAVLTVIAGFAILFTGRYPRGIFDFNVGVLRWTWRVSYYAAWGGLGTDRYPPFTTDLVDGYPATLEIEYPGELSRGLVLVKWWLLVLPHYFVLAFLTGSGWVWGGGLLALLVLIAAVSMLFTGTYPPSLFDLVIGLNRWAFRVAAYAGLMTDRYPPFRLDQGGLEPEPEPVGR
jgi:hypothetical protein